MRRSAALVPLLAAAAALLGSPPASGGSVDMHLRLERARPAPDSTLTGPPAELRFWFTEEPRLEPTTIRLVGPDGELVELGDLHADRDDASILFLAVEGRVSPGRQRVVWRTMARDGHVVRGDYTFTVAPAAGR